MTTEGSPSPTRLAEQRTYLAAERTLFAVLRTGLAIAAGGSVIVSLLGDRWPSWIQVPLASVFLVVGYALVLLGLRRYQSIARRVEARGGKELDIVPVRTMTILTYSLEIAITVVVVLFLTGSFNS